MPKKLIVTASIWKKPHLTYKKIVRGKTKKIAAETLQDCRDYAERNGYQGIRVQFK